MQAISLFVNILIVIVLLLIFLVFIMLVVLFIKDILFPKKKKEAAKETVKETAKEPADKEVKKAEETVREVPKEKPVQTVTLANKDKTALELLKERYAKGEITTDDYKQMKKELDN